MPGRRRERSPRLTGAGHGVRDERQTGQAGGFRRGRRGHDHLVPVQMFDHRPRRCPFGHDVGRGHAKVSWTPCGCGPALEANERGRGLGHITVTCSMCWDQRRVTRFFEPPHDTRHPTARLGQAPARADPEAIPAWIEEGQAREGRRADAAVAGRARQVRVPLFNPRSPCGLRPGAWPLARRLPRRCLSPPCRRRAP